MYVQRDLYNKTLESQGSQTMRPEKQWTNVKKNSTHSAFLSIGTIPISFNRKKFVFWNYFTHFWFKTNLWELSLNDFAHVMLYNLWSQI